MDAKPPRAGPVGPTDPATLEFELRRKTARLSVEFGMELLAAAGTNPVITFGDVLKLAARWVIERPTGAAQLLAAAMAIDLGNTQVQSTDESRRKPSAN